MIAVIDYGVGNIFSLVSALENIGARSVVTSDKDIISNADKIILPGVGAFGDAMDRLSESGLKDLLVSLAKGGKPFLGICLGMQLLFDSSTEYGYKKGLGLLKGEVTELKKVVPKGYSVPQMGWNSLRFEKDDPIFKYIKDGDYVYYVHSYYAGDVPSRIAYSDYGVNVSGVVRDGNVCGMQFHPEKSGEVGLNLLRAWCEEA